MSTHHDTAHPPATGNDDPDRNGRGPPPGLLRSRGEDGGAGIAAQVPARVFARRASIEDARVAVELSLKGQPIGETDGASAGPGLEDSEGPQIRWRSVPPATSSRTTIQGCAFQAVSRRKPASASAKSGGERTALVQTGL